MCKTLTTEEFIKKAHEVHGDKYDYSKVEYKNSSTKVCVICPEHGEFWQISRNHLRGQSCPKCSHKKSQKNANRHKKLFFQKYKKMYGDKYDTSEAKYIDRNTKMLLMCPEHGKFWKSPSSLLNGRACPKCHKKAEAKHIRTTEEFTAEARKVHGDIYDYSKVEYDGRKIKVCIICPIHGEFWQLPHHHINGSGCPKCGANNVSELKLYDRIKEIYTDAIYQYRPDFIKRQSIDIFIPSINVGIEYQGRQHFVAISKFGGEEEFERTKERDMRKYNLCKENGIEILYYTNEIQNCIPTDYISTVYTDFAQLANVIENLKENN